MIQSECESQKETYKICGWGGEFCGQPEYGRSEAGHQR